VAPVRPTRGCQPHCVTKQLNDRLPSRAIAQRTVFWPGAFFLYLLACTPNTRPAHPATVPSSAIWVDGVFIECSVETNSRANRCTIYGDSTGEVLESGLFILSGGGREATKAELKYAAFAGLVIYLQDARLLSPLRPAQRSTPRLVELRPRPWIVPADFRELLRMSELVVSGTIEDTAPIGVQRVDHIELPASTAHIRVDRVFQGHFTQKLQFTWFTARHQEDSYIPDRRRLASGPKSDTSFFSTRMRRAGW